jgi:hypothetical protein
MKRRNRTQRGQALILVALAIVGLVGFTALAIDGSIVFSNHRHSQNASDTAAYAAALSYVRDTAGAWKQAAIDRAADNGYSNADGFTKVDVFLCSELDPPPVVDGRKLECDSLPDGADPSEYVYVHIKSKVDLFFARVLGWRDFVDHTDAVVLADTAKETSWFPGYALVSTMLGCKPDHYNHDPFKVEGKSVTTIVDAGILVNADCQNPQPAYDQRNAASKVETDTGVCVVGDAMSTNTSPAPDDDCEPIDVNHYTLPRPLCENYPDGKIVKKDGEYYATAGRYGRDFDFDSIVDENPNGTVRLYKGIYCFYDGLDMNSGWNVTTDWNKNGEHDSDLEGVFFYVPSGDIKFNGGSEAHLHAIDSLYQGFPKDYLKYLIYVPPSNPNEIVITGSNGSDFTGTILAPASYVRLNGGSDTVGLNSQVIGYAVALEGNGTLEIHYDANQNATTTYNPSLSGID